MLIRWQIYGRCRRWMWENGVEIKCHSAPSTLSLVHRVPVEHQRTNALRFREKQVFGLRLEKSFGLVIKASWKERPCRAASLSEASEKWCFLGCHRLLARLTESLQPVSQPLYNNGSKMPYSVPISDSPWHKCINWAQTFFFMSLHGCSTKKMLSPYEWVIIASHHIACLPMNELSSPLITLFTPQTPASPFSSATLLLFRRAT